MATNQTTICSDKIKFLDQMLEDIAGDEFDDCEDNETDIDTDLKRFAKHAQLSSLDNIR